MRSSVLRSLLFAAPLLTLLTTDARAADLRVSDVDALRAAIRDARPGDTITLADGVYPISGNITCATDARSAPITVRAASALGAHLRFDAPEGFKVNAAGWRFEDLKIEGACATDSACEHAFHLAGDADQVVLARNTVWNYNAHLKSNGAGDPRQFPDDVLIEGNTFYNDAPRQTSNPVTPIDVVGGKRWIIRANLIYDFAKAQGNNISYGAFLKGGSRDGLIERNLILCEREHTGFTRIGLSIGGGGTSPDSICEGGSCTPEHQGALVRNNIVARCPESLGLYVNKGQNTRVFHNLFYDVTGVDIRFASSSADVRYNVMSGRLRTRDGASMTQEHNLTEASLAQWMSWFTAPAQGDFTLTGLPDTAQAPLDAVPDDFCGQPRGQGDAPGATQRGVPCDTSRVHLGGVTDPEPNEDMPADMVDVPDMIDMAPAPDMPDAPADMVPDQGGAPDASPDTSPELPDTGGAPGTPATPSEDEGGCGGCAAAAGQGAPSAPLGLLLFALLGARAARRRRIA